MRFSGLRLCGFILLLALTAAPFVRGQGLAQTLSSTGAAMGPNGFGLYSVSLYGAYSSTTVPFGSGLGSIGAPITTTGGGTSGPNYLTGIVASMGWRHMGSRTLAFLTYTPSYDASVKYFSPNSFNNFLTFGLMRDLALRWTWTATGMARTARWDEFLFSPTEFASIASSPVTFEDLVSGLLAGKYTNGELASILTGSPQIESPASSLLYGTRFFNTSMRLGVMYDHSAALKLHWGLTGTRVQHLNEGGTGDNSVYLVPQTTTASASAGATYAISPFTFVNLDLSASRTFTSFEDEYISSAVGSIGHVVGRHIIVQVRGGGGILTPVHETFSTSRPGPHYLAGATATYKALNYTFMGSFNHTITDSYGLGATQANAASGALYGRLSGRWSVGIMGRYEYLQDVIGHNLNAWVGNVGIGRPLDRHTMVRAGYFYGRTSGVFEGVRTDLPIQGVQLVFGWMPQEQFGI